MTESPQAQIVNTIYKSRHFAIEHVRQEQEVSMANSKLIAGLFRNLVAFDIVFLDVFHTSKQHNAINLC